jgi:hypothetical protein
MYNLNREQIWLTLPYGILYNNDQYREIYSLVGF